MMLHVIVPVHNRAAISEAFAAATAKQTYSEYCLILVDDGCTDDTVARVRACIGETRLVVLKGSGNLWWAGALQLAYVHLQDKPSAENDAVLIINDDVKIAPDFFEQGLRVLSENRRACVQAIGLDPVAGEVDRGAVADLRRLDFRPAREREVPNCLSTRGLLMTMGTFKRSGGFRPRWLPHYLSDYEFTLRLQRQGARLMVDDRFRLEMDLSATGIDSPSAGSVRELWRQALSNRAKFNPMQWSAFVLMACPWTVVPGQLARIWLRFARTLLRTAMPRQRTAS